MCALPEVDDGFSHCVQRRAAEYVDVFQDSTAVYDLDQLPTGRPRKAAAGSPLFILTEHTRLVWSPTEKRCLRRAELGAAMCLPAHAAIATRYGSHVVTFESLSRSAAAQMVGNGMSLPSVGSVVAWCCAYITLTGLLYKQKASI